MLGVLRTDPSLTRVAVSWVTGRRISWPAGEGAATVSGAPGGALTAYVRGGTPVVDAP